MKTLVLLAVAVLFLNAVLGNEDMEMDEMDSELSRVERSISKCILKWPKCKKTSECKKKCGKKWKCRKLPWKKRGRCSPF